MTVNYRWIRDTAEGATFAVRVAPRASRTAITGLWGEGPQSAVKVTLATPPIEGKANAELIRYLASILEVHRSRVEMITGAHSKNKVVRVRGRSAAEAAALLARFIPDISSELP